MRRMIKRAVLTLGLFALVVACAAPTAEAGWRYRARIHSYGPTYHSRATYYPHRGVYRVRVYAPPVVAVPVAPVPYYDYYRGPSDYYHGPSDYFHYHVW